MKNKYLVLLFALAWLVIVSCTPNRGHGNAHNIHKHRKSTVSQEVKQLKPVCKETSCKGGYAYQDDTGLWWYYYFYFSSNDTNVYLTQNSNTLPAGGSWTKIEEAPDVDDVFKEETLNIEENSQGIPGEESVANEDGMAHVGDENMDEYEDVDNNADVESGSDSFDSGDSGGFDGGGDSGGE